MTETFRRPSRAPPAPPAALCPHHPSPSRRFERRLVHPAAAYQSVEDMKAYTVGKTVAAAGAEVGEGLCVGLCVTWLANGVACA